MSKLEIRDIFTDNIGWGDDQVTGIKQKGDTYFIIVSNKKKV
jgi:hypothetical protein